MTFPLLSPGRQALRILTSSRHLLLVGPTSGLQNPVPLLMCCCAMDWERMSMTFPLPSPERQYSHIPDTSYWSAPPVAAHI